LTKTKLILIRHGQTEWNLQDRLRGRSEIELDDTGIKQAQAAADHIATWQVSAVYSSPLQRAMTTAQIVARRFGLEVEKLPGVIDIDYGEWQGLSLAEVAKRDITLRNLWLESPEKVKFPGGESLAEVRSRATAAIDDVVLRHQGKTVAVVSHKVVCQVLLLDLLGLDDSHFWQITQDVAAVNLLEYRDRSPSALLINDTCHLKHLVSAN